MEGRREGKQEGGEEEREEVGRRKKEAKKRASLVGAAWLLGDLGWLGQVVQAKRWRLDLDSPSVDAIPKDDGLIVMQSNDVVERPREFGQRWLCMDADQFSRVCRYLLQALQLVGCQDLQ